MVELLSILVLTFSSALILLGLITLWLERGPGRWQGIAVSLLGLLMAAGYGFLGSRFSEAIFDRLIVRVDWPTLIGRVIAYGVGVMGGATLAVGLFLWVTGRYQVWQIRRRVLVLILGAVLMAILLTFIAVRISHLMP